MPSLAPPLAGNVTDCPLQTTFNCTTPSCAFTGQVVNLNGTCTAADGLAVAVYAIDGRNTTTATCPQPGVTVNVSVTPAYTSPDFADCVYPAVTSLQLQSARRAMGCMMGCAGPLGVQRGACSPSPRLAPSLAWALPRHPPLPAALPSPPCPTVPTISCNSVPTCSSPGQVVVLVGSCTASNPNATLVYVVNGQAVTTATCPAANQHLDVSVKPVYPARPQCNYNATLAFTLQSAHARHATCVCSSLLCCLGLLVRA